MKVICQNICFSYGDKPLLQDLQLTVEKGSHVWIRGKSGSGKSSLLKLILGLLIPTTGHIQVGEFEMTQLSDEKKRKVRKAEIGYVHQENHLIDHWTVEQNLNLVSLMKDWQEAFRKLNLDPSLRTKMAARLSGGEKQRISLLRMLYQQPKLALLDEPTSHLDDETTEKTLDFLKKKLHHSTVLIVSHDHRLSSFDFKPVEFGDLFA